MVSWEPARAAAGSRLPSALAFAGVGGPAGTGGIGGLRAVRIFSVPPLSRRSGSRRDFQPVPPGSVTSPEPLGSVVWEPSGFSTGSSVAGTSGV